MLQYLLYFTTLPIFIVVAFALLFVIPDEFVISNCLKSTNNYQCNSWGECDKMAQTCGDTCSVFDFIGDRDYCLWDQSAYSKNPEKYCNAMEKEFMKQQCLDWAEQGPKKID